MRSIIFATVWASLATLLTASPTPTDPKHLSYKRSSMTPITIKGNAFWQGDKRFYVRGIDYQPGGSSAMEDPLANETVCKRDIAEFVKLGVNTIRVYMTDNSVSHDVCMGALADAGIYVIIDANNPLYSINRLNPEPSYNSEYLQSVFSTIDAFSKYDNTLAFFSGNEVVNDDIESTLAAVYVKATTRDMRQYIASRDHRKIPVGYSSADVNSNRIPLAHYMNCGPDDQRSDFYAFNDYSWCNTDMERSGWNQKVKQFTGYGIPIFLSEYGCNTNGPQRDFGEVKALMSDSMTNVYSGGLVYEYSAGPNMFGIVNITSGGADEMPDFDKYRSALAANPAPNGDGGCTLTSNSMPCPTKDANWLVDGTSLPPMPEKAKVFMANGAGTGPGLKGAGSQNAGDGDSNSGTTTAPAVTATATTSASTSKASTSNSKNAAGNSVGGRVSKGPFAVTGVFIAFSVIGALLL
ncbi:Glucanosyltransferase domain containing protein [Rhypophila sp. PSN 637]